MSENKENLFGKSVISPLAMREAENMLHTEFAHALGIQPGEVADFIRAELQGQSVAEEA